MARIYVPPTSRPRVRDRSIQWKPSCKTGSAKWSYDGICADPEVFGVLMNLGGPPTFKMKKFSVADFENCLGGISASVRYVPHCLHILPEVLTVCWGRRYDTLYITSKEVTVRWSDTGEFKFGGSYGKYQPS